MLEVRFRLRLKKYVAPLYETFCSISGLLLSVERGTEAASIPPPPLLRMVTGTPFTTRGTPSPNSKMAVAAYLLLVCAAVACDLQSPEIHWIDAESLTMR